jgi:hypothetical protein
VEHKRKRQDEWFHKLWFLYSKKDIVEEKRRERVTYVMQLYVLKPLDLEWFVALISKTGFRAFAPASKN